MAVDVTQAIQDLIQRILNDREAAVEYSEDPEGTLAAQGITEGDTSGLDMFQTVRDTCGSTVPGLRDYGPSSGPAGGAAGGPTPPPASSSGASMDQVVQHMNYVTYETYKNDETIVQNIDNSQDNSTSIDQSQNTEVNVDAEDGKLGDVNVDVDSNDTNVNATGDGSAASAGGPAVSGDENLVNTGTNVGQQNTGDQAAQAVQVGGGGRYSDGIVQNTGDGGVATGGDAESVNTGEFTGIQSGDATTVSGGALSFGEGDASNAQGNTVAEGGALAQGGDATGVKSDNDVTSTEVTTEVNTVNAQNSNVQTEQGEGDASQEDLVDVNAAGPAPVREIADVENAPVEAFEEEDEEVQI